MAKLTAEQKALNAIAYKVRGWLYLQEERANGRNYRMPYEDVKAIGIEAQEAAQAMLTDYLSKRGAGGMWLHRMLQEASDYDPSNNAARPALYKYLGL